ncbi:MAG: tetratricopeptide repeat protein [Ekhidna sp.]
MKRYLTLLLFGLTCTIYAQPNCSVFEGVCQEACEIAIQPIGGQGSRASQEKYDRAIEKCPDRLAYAYMQKAIPYLKRGDFVTWKKLIDKAVEIDPVGQLGYRGWCRFQFLRDYEGAIADLEQLEQMLPGNIGYSQNGDYHLKTALALCYKQIGETAKAIDILEQHTSEENYVPWAYEFLHLGVMQLESGKYEEALAAFEKQLKTNDYLAETYYYRGLAYQIKGDLAAYQENMLKAQEYYQSGKRMFDVYTTKVDNVDLSDIERHLTSID